MPAARRRRPPATQRPELATVWGPVDTLPVGEDCLTLHVWTPGSRQRQAPGHGLAAWRRLLLRLGQLAALRQRQPRAAQRRRGRGGQSPAQHLRPSRPVGAAASVSPSRAMPACSISSPRSNGCATTSPRFGGDPGNVTIFGQSGGGGKVSALLAHARAPRACSTRPIMQSGASVRFAERERTTRLADAVLKHLGRRRRPARHAAGLAAGAPAGSRRARRRRRCRARAYPLLDRYNFGPVIDGSVLPAPSVRSCGAGAVGRHPDPDRRHQGRSGDLPRTRRRGVEPHRSARTISRKRIAAVAGDAAAELVAYYKRRDPAASPADRLITALTMSNFAVRSNMLAERKAARGKAPVWVYDFAWEIAGLRRPPEVLPFGRSAVRVRYARCDRRAAPQARRAGAGRPRLADLGHVRPATGKADWPAYTAGKRSVMVFDDTCKVVDRSRRRGPSALEQGRQ